MRKSVCPAVARPACHDGEPGGGPVTDLGVFVQREAGGGRGYRVHADVPAIDQYQRVLAFEAGRGGLDGDGLLLAGNNET